MQTNITGLGRNDILDQFRSGRGILEPTENVRRGCTDMVDLVLKLPVLGTLIPPIGQSRKEYLCGSAIEFNELPGRSVPRRGIHLHPAGSVDQAVDPLDVGLAGSDKEEENEKGNPKV
jgi:hypothetical protein